MNKFRKSRVLQIVGALGAVAWVIVFIAKPSFPTPDKLLVFMTFVAMIFGQTKNMLKRFLPFAVLLFVYESFRGIAPYLNTRVNFLWMPDADRFLFFGNLPTKVLQDWWWTGEVQWYDFVLYGPYTLHFVMPFALGVLIWRTREKQYWNFMATFVICSFMAFITYVLFPAAPPWLADEKGLIEPIVRVSSEVWRAFGIYDFPGIYNKVSPNPVAAVPSLHAAYSFLVAFFVTRLYKTKWRWLAWTFPLLIWVGTVYQGEHYVIDVIIGVIYALVAYKLAPYIVSGLQKSCARVKLKLVNN